MGGIVLGSLGISYFFCLSIFYRIGLDRIGLDWIKLDQTELSWTGLKLRRMGVYLFAAVFQTGNLPALYIHTWQFYHENFSS